MKSGYKKTSSWCSVLWRPPDIHLSTINKQTFPLTCVVEKHSLKSSSYIFWSERCFLEIFATLPRTGLRKSSNCLYFQCVKCHFIKSNHLACFWANNHLAGFSVRPASFNLSKMDLSRYQWSSISLLKTMISSRYRRHVFYWRDPQIVVIGWWKGCGAPFKPKGII